jgi:sialic acid synthase SpsE
LQGNCDKHLTETERRSGHETSFRRAVYPASDIKAGTIIKEENLVTLRPLSGIGAEDFYKVVGKKAKVDLTQNQVLDWEMFD